MRKLKKAIAITLSYIKLWHWVHNDINIEQISLEKFEAEVFCSYEPRLLHLEWLKDAPVDPLLKLQILEGASEAETLLCNNIS